MPGLINVVLLISEILIYAGIVQGFYSAFVLYHTLYSNPANKYLSVLLVILSFSIIHSAYIIPYFHTSHSTSFQIKEPFLLLVVPLIWLYVKKLNEPQFLFKTKHLLHFLPFLTVMLFSFLYVMHNNGQANNNHFHSHTLQINIVLYVVTVAQFAFYLVYILRITRSIKTKALNEFSNTENIDPLWIKIFLVTFLVVFALIIFMMAIAIHSYEAKYFNLLVMLVFSAAIFVLGYKGLFQKSILVEHVSENTINTAETTQITSNGKLDEKLLNNLLEYMQTQKPFHEPELTLTSMANQLNLGRNQLSELINSRTGGNFYDFVNKYRVEEVKQLIGNPKYKDYTLLAIAYEAGFSSKSTFNSIFKKFTGLTPSEYKGRREKEKN